jgi:uncharacterized membrane protein YbhN (UPF0104 family)
LKKITKIIRLLIALACIAYLVKFFYSDRQALKVVLKLDFASIAYIVALTVAYFLIYNFRLKLVFEKCSGQILPFWPVFKLLMLANFLNMVLSQVGNIYRAVRLKSEFNVSYTSYVSSLSSIYWLDTCFNFIVAIIVILTVKSDFQIGIFSAWKLFMVLALLVIAAPVAADTLLSKIKIKNNFLAWIHSKLSEVFTVTINNLKDFRYILKIMVLGIPILLITVAGQFILFRGFGIILTIPALLVFYVLLRLSTFITITPGNIGVQEIAYGFLSQQMGIGMAQGILVSVVARVLSSIVIISMGLLFGGIDALRLKNNTTILETDSPE